MNARTSGGVFSFNAARSGWNSVATKKGWPSISTARTSPSPPRPTIRSGPFSRSRSLRGANPYRQWYSSTTAVVPYATASREPVATETAPTCSTSAHDSGVISGSGALGSSSACVAFAIPKTFCAYSRSACWNPPQVPRNGLGLSRAKRIAASAAAAFAYGLPGTHQTPEDASRVRSGLGPSCAV